MFFKVKLFGYRFIDVSTKDKQKSVTRAKIHLNFLGSACTTAWSSNLSKSHKYEYSIFNR